VTGLRTSDHKSSSNKSVQNGVPLSERKEIFGPVTGDTCVGYGIKDDDQMSRSLP